MWSVVPVEQGEAISKSTNPMDVSVVYAINTCVLMCMYKYAYVYTLPQQVKTNVPGPSSRTLRTYIAEGSMTTDAKIQV